MTMATVQAVLDRKGSLVASIGLNATALEAAQQMNERRIGALVVLEGEMVIGIVTERDILRRVVAVERDPTQVRVFDIMTTPVACCRLSTTLEECRAVMTERRIRRLPVVEGGTLMGIVTMGDVMAYDLTDTQRTISYLYEYLYSPMAPIGLSVH